MERLQWLDDEVTELQGKFSNTLNENNKALERIKKCEAFVQAAAMDVQQIEDHLQDLRFEEDNLDDKITKMASNLNKPYMCPVSKAKWDDCIEESHKQFKNEYNNRQKDLSAKLRLLREQLKERKVEIGQLESELKESRIQLGKTQEDLSGAREDLQSTGERLSKAQKQLAEKVRAVAEEKWKSRADLFISENTSDQSTINLMIVEAGSGL